MHFDNNKPNSRVFFRLRFFLQETFEVHFNSSVFKLYLSTAYMKLFAHNSNFNVSNWTVKLFFGYKMVELYSAFKIQAYFTEWLLSASYCNKHFGLSCWGNDKSKDLKRNRSTYRNLKHVSCVSIVGDT